MIVRLTIISHERCDRQTSNGCAWIYGNETYGKALNGLEAMRAKPLWNNLRFQIAEPIDLYKLELH